MIHAYNEQFLNIIQFKVACMFELATLEEKIEIDDFSSIFIASNVSKAIEKDDPVYVLGNPLMNFSLILNKDPLNIELNSEASPEYWVGWTLSYAQWYFNRSFATIINAFPCSKLINYYFPYHEMDIKQSMDLIAKHLDLTCALKRYGRKKD